MNILTKKIVIKYKEGRKNQLAAQAEALIAQMPIKFRVQFIESMNLKYSKNFDETIKSDKYDEIASKIIELMPEANCIPVGYY